MSRIFVGNLPDDIRRTELEELFDRYGRIRDVDVKLARSGPGAFAFIEFDDERDAQDAVRARDGHEFDRRRLRVEVSHGGRRARPGRSDGPPGRDGAQRSAGDAGPGGRRGPPSRSEWRVRIMDLPRSASWQVRCFGWNSALEFSLDPQDVKDFVRPMAEPCFADCDRRGNANVEFFTEEEMRRVVQKLDGQEFSNRYDRVSATFPSAPAG